MLRELWNWMFFEFFYTRDDAPNFLREPSLYLQMCLFQSVKVTDSGIKVNALFAILRVRTERIME